jgi:RNA polymerase sigma factor
LLIIETNNVIFQDQGKSDPAMRKFDKRVIAAAKDAQQLSALIEEHERFILRRATKTAKHHITKNDDEWSIALAAFYDAIQKYNYEKGSFIAFAELLIHNKLIDYYRSQNKYDAELQVDWIDDNAADDSTDYSIKYEIEALGEVLSNYGFTFTDLAECSPKTGKTRASCAKAAAYMLDNPLLVAEMRSTKQLPLKVIEKNTQIPRKIMERHRKYLVAAVEILSGDYPYLSEYLRYIKEAVK